ncbi:MAG: hypothetical protein IJS81_12255, partial [Selenomonadaceae bacterium]|nr:hypothetical protein [Selenomonadaceae bacterium]
AYYMAQFPLVWVYRYEDDDYYYEIVAKYQPNENYKAYAHTDANGVVQDYFYHSLFPASIYNGTAITEFNSTPAGNLTAAHFKPSISRHKLAPYFLVAISINKDAFNFNRQIHRYSSSFRQWQ